MSQAVELNRAYYEELTPGREDYWRKMAGPRHRLAVLLGALADLHPSSVADVGCGNGALLAEVARRVPAARLTGFDLATTQIEANTRAIPSVRWRTGDLALPDAVPAEEQGMFDAVISSEVIEHVDQPLTFLENALTLARPGSGHLLLSTQSGRVRETERRVGHLRHFSVEEMTALLVQAGWQPVRVWNDGFPFHDLSKWYANRNPDASMKQFGEKPYGLKEDLICAALRLAFLLNSHSRGAQLFAVARRS